MTSLRHAADVAGRPPDTVLHHGRIVTMDPRRPIASTMVISDGQIVAVGDDVDPHPRNGGRVIDLEGRTVVPGFIDPHTHLAGNAQDVRNVEGRDFFDRSVDSVEAILDRIAKANAELPPGEWVVGVASPLQGARMREGRLPNREELDAVVPQRPAFITVGPHLLLANTRALEACSITADAADPAGGLIERDSQGNPTGWMREVAQRPFKEGRPNPYQDLADRILAELERCASRGVTMVHDIVTSPAEVRAYQRLAREGRLPVRVRLVPRVFQAQFDTWGVANLGLLPGFGGDVLSVGAVKISIDGGSSAGQAAFYPVSGSSDDDAMHPVLRMTQQEADEIISTYHAAGMQLLVHAVGDLALDMVLRSFEVALAGAPRSDHRHRIEHMGNYGLTAERAGRARSLGLIAVPNPSSLHYLSARTIHNYGPERLGRQYPFRWLAGLGLPFAFASDGGGLWPVDPLRDIATCVTRRTHDGVVLDASESIPAEVALRCYTVGAAWAGFGESKLGQIAEGRLADFAVLAADPLDPESADIAHIGVDATFLAGRVTYDSGNMSVRLPAHLHRHGERLDDHA